jgi:hypothetical protein
MYRTDCDTVNSFDKLALHTVSCYVVTLSSPVYSCSHSIRLGWYVPLIGCHNMLPASHFCPWSLRSLVSSQELLVYLLYGASVVEGKNVLHESQRYWYPKAWITSHQQMGPVPANKVHLSTTTMIKPGGDKGSLMTLRLISIPRPADVVA